MYKRKEVIAVALFSLVTARQQASYAGYGNLFSGANDGDVKNNCEHNSTTKADSNGTACESVPAKDYTIICVSLRQRYNNDESNARAIIARGEQMMKSRDLKTRKKGAIFKRIGEKELDRLKDLPTQSSAEEKNGARPDAR